MASDDNMKKLQDLIKGLTKISQICEKINNKRKRDAVEDDHEDDHEESQDMSEDSESDAASDGGLDDIVLAIEEDENDDEREIYAAYPNYELMLPVGSSNEEMKNCVYDVLDVLSERGLLAAFFDKFRVRPLKEGEKWAGRETMEGIFEKWEVSRVSRNKKQMCIANEALNYKFAHYRNELNNASGDEIEKYFARLDVRHKRAYIKKIQDIISTQMTFKPYQVRVLESNMSVECQRAVLRKLAMLESMEPTNGEYHKLKQWIDTLMLVPFGVYKTFDVSIENGVESCNEFIERTIAILNDTTYGMNDAKMQVLQLIGQLLTNPNSVGQAIAISGAMGTGKTTIVKDGFSRILGRPFAFVALGGATDSSFLEGHSVTYEGSVWGHIVDILIKSQCMNPIIYFDELDKISDTARGEEIMNILMHLTDTTQNRHFQDKYFAGIDFDLSKVLFFFSYNDETKVNPILLDRMYKIRTTGYTQDDKIVIARKYLLPEIMANVKMSQTDITIGDDVLIHVINMVEEEKGVRNLKRALEIIVTKLNLFRLVKNPQNMFHSELNKLRITFPLTLTIDLVKQLNANNADSVINHGHMSMYM